jgi:23S rRNA (pseudouridine1915-N3)-methyltransferase
MIQILSAAKVREKYIREGINEYAKRINKYNKISKKRFKTTTQANKQAKGYTVVLDEKGDRFTSKQFSKLLKNKSITFIVGPPEGFKVLPEHDKKISFSRMTFPYQLIMLFLYEQVYRGYTILNNESYHKE